MRAATTCLLTLLFMASYNIFVLSGLYGFTDEFMRKVAIYSLFILFYLPISIMGNSNKKSRLEIEFRKQAQIINFICVSLIIINQFGILQNILHISITFNGLSFVVVCLFVINAYKNGYFKNRHGLE